jgi:hypothetical protein
VARVVDVPVFITCRDRVTDLRHMVQWFERAACQHIFLIDNQSTYPPLIEYLEQSPHEVIWLGQNHGPRALWNVNLTPTSRYVLTDPDLDLRGLPLDAIDHLADIMDKYQRPKVGLGLRLDDVPETMPSLEWERRLLVPDKSKNDWWAGEIAHGVYDSLIDTTFALYEAGSGFQYEAIRTGFPYLARHTPWYMTEADDEWSYYTARAEHGPNGTTTQIG